MARRPLPLYWRVFAVNAGLLTAIAIVLIVAPVTISFPIAVFEGIGVVVGLVVTIAINALLLRHAFAPLARLEQRMETVDLLRPGQRLQIGRDDEIGSVVGTFNRMLDRLEAERQESGRRVLAAQEAERVGIARDLHDEVGQVLTGVLLQLNSIAEGAPEHEEALDEARQAVRHALDEVRRISSELRPEMLEQLGLVSALTELTSSFSRVTGIAVERQFATALPKLTPEVELAIYRIAQESLTNVARHAQARRVVDLARAGPRERRPARRRRRPRLRRLADGARRPPEHARARAARRRRARDQAGARRRRRGAARSPDAANASPPESA